MSRGNKETKNCAKEKMRDQKKSEENKIMIYFHEIQLFVSFSRICRWFNRVVPIKDEMFQSSITERIFQYFFLHTL